VHQDESSWWPCAPGGTRMIFMKKKIISVFFGKNLSRFGYCPASEEYRPHKKTILMIFGYDLTQRDSSLGTSVPERDFFLKLIFYYITDIVVILFRLIGFAFLNKK
jgi:hypothetical protein